MTITTRLLFPAVFLFASLGLGASGAHADVTTATLAMENPDNPLLLMRTSRGDVYLELFPQAAPRNVAHFIALAHGELPLVAASADTRSVETNDQDRAGAAPHYWYDNLDFHRVLPGYIIQAGAPRTPDSPGPETTLDDEINARQLGLHEEKVLDDGGNPHPWLNLQDAGDFQREVLVPLYRRMGITTPEMLETRQSEVFSTLRDMTLQQAYENRGYRYNDRLPSHQPVRGAVAMAGSEPNSNRSEFFITLTDAPWLAGRTTVIGQVVEGMEVV
ncbi:MAG: peptidylprolyl isomerase, partial [Pseudomonas sp.]